MDSKEGKKKKDFPSKQLNSAVFSLDSEIKVLCQMEAGFTPANEDMKKALRNSIKELCKTISDLIVP